MTTMFFAAEVLAEDVTALKLEDMALDLPAHTILYYMMSYASFIIGFILMMDQYFGRRIHCFTPENFNQPPLTTSEYCWEHGYFAKNETASHYVPTVAADYLLSSYVYFLIRGFAFLVPHMLWALQYKPTLGAMVRESTVLLTEVERMWLKYSEVVSDVYQEMQGKVKSAKTVQLARSVCMSVTRDVARVNKQLMRNYKGVSTFMQCRMVWDMIVLPVFILLDVALFLNNNFYIATDFYCPLPNTETLRCVVPVLQFQWHALLCALISAGVALIATLINTVWLSKVLIQSSTDDCILERLPYAKEVADLSWSSYSTRKAYKLISIILMQNVRIIQSVLFLEGFVRHLQDENLIANADEVPMLAVTTAGDEEDGGESVNDASPIWLRGKRQAKPKKV